MKKAVTLTELIIAIALMGFIILGVTSFDAGSRQFLQSSERKTQVLNEAALIMDRITKDAFIAVGNSNAAAVVVDTNANTLTIHQDTDTNGVADTDVVYTIAGNQIQRTAGANPADTLTNRAFTFTPSLPVNNTAQVLLALVFDPGQPHATPQARVENPEVTLQSNLEVPGWSLN